MSISKYVSQVKTVDSSQQSVYDYLSNFENLSVFLNEGVLEKLTEKVPQVKISDVQIDQDSCRFNVSGFGASEIRIIERDPAKTVKVESSGGLPLSFTFWIQLLPVTDCQSKIRLTLHADMSMMVKMMVGNKLQEGVDKLADTLSQLPYSQGS